MNLASRERRRTAKSGALLLSFAVLQVVSIGLSQPAQSRNALQAKTVLDDANTELYSPAFIPNSTSIAVVRKTHEPDGHEAESFSEKELAEISDRKKTKPRWADPEVTIVTEDGKERLVVDHGWNPEPSVKGDSIFYIRQVKPISGFRVLAETQTGNSLFSYDIAKKDKKELVVPSTGYLDAPIACLKDEKIAYELCDATNGAWGGQVGAGVFDLSTGTSQTVLQPQKHFKLFDLIGSMFWNGTNLIAVRRVAQTEGTHLADKYTWEVVNLSKKYPAVLYASKTPVELTGDFQPTVATNDEKSLKIHDKDSDKIIDVESGKVLSESKPILEKTGKSVAVEGMSSPDGKFKAAISGKNLEVTVTSNASKMSLKLPGDVQAIAWSPDSSKIAVVVTKQRNQDQMGVFDRDSLLVVTVPQK